MMDSRRKILALGGARSGKSSFARHTAEASGLDPVLIATATALDAEMMARIARHRQERGPDWLTLEEPLDLAGTVAVAAAPNRVVVVDCLTLWLTNVMLDGGNVEAEIAALLLATRQSTGPVILVSNEVGQGVVPETPLGRAFRDAQGQLNQAMAEACSDVVLIAAGLPLRLKPAQSPF
ncbi:bifunctional adenosylcobinamide kinase/adenosylcobinamide-phosphate guanylyltransferase [Roseiarcaceae bacterium H3SJ34-1]|uniref:bifunctional adenosylcobinamide kinase/adenosylcobinamide-phosphate guanylyltransferase n=1 Tax=Terripilifer ovatus TaxID=3032367 RepID=UPI003AB97FA9|nr:bifunctional adenosylcobinamide kinase/adenosylcobinamide-phosphate guanylyltransferase [Roseiarcaceae bacterium H3SJ34-1]